MDMRLVWSDTTEPKLDNLIRALDPSYHHFPACWVDSDGTGGPPVENPLVMHFCVDHPDGYPLLKYALDLEELVMEEVDSSANLSGMVARQEPSRAVFEKMAAAFRSLADKIDQRLEA